MEMLILVTSNMLPIPNAIHYRVLSNSYKIKDKINDRKIEGKECFLAGNKETFINWLKKFPDLYIAIERGKWTYYAVKQE